MKREYVAALSSATVAVALLFAQFAAAQSKPCHDNWQFNGGYSVGVADYRCSSAAATQQSMPSNDDSSTAAMQQAAPRDDNSTAAMEQAIETVPAQVYLDRTLDARKVKQGDTVKATLFGKVELKSGTELPSGTEINGQVTVDQMENDGTFRLALVFTNVQLKNGTVIPIKATIMKVYPSPGAEAWDYTPSEVSPLAKDWTKQTFQVDQPGALAGVDFHSRIAGENSGNFVSNKKDQIRVSSGNLLGLEIGVQQPN